MSWGSHGVVFTCVSAKQPQPYLTHSTPPPLRTDPAPHPTQEPVQAVGPSTWTTSLLTVSLARAVCVRACVCVRARVC